ncbi:MAG: SufE family protein [Halobacteria archaeon]|nr:SufE family protein [Halobacteria archaeon]
MTTLADIVDIFELLEDWEQRYQYLIELGEKLPPMPAEHKTEDNKVRGCMSQVWVHPYTDIAEPSKLHYYGDCDTSIIKGVLALLIQLADNKTAAELDQLDVDEIFERLNLDDHLSPNRHVGVYAIVELMKQQAREIQKRRVRVA